MILKCDYKLNFYVRMAYAIYEYEEDDYNWGWSFDHIEDMTDLEIMSGKEVDELEAAVKWKNSCGTDKETKLVMVYFPCDPVKVQEMVRATVSDHKKELFRLKKKAKEKASKAAKKKEEAEAKKEAKKRDKELKKLEELKQRYENTSNGK